MTTKHKLLSGLALFTAMTGCVSNRPARNGVFNENQYVRKDFLIRPGDGSKADPGWFMGVTVASTSTPNPLASVSGAGLFAGSAGPAPNFVRFAVTQDKVQLIDQREISNDPSVQAQNLRTPNILNAWSASSVDLKYRINLDGEITNFYEENQEQDWQVRQWVKLNFAKNDMTDLWAFFGSVNPVIQNCVDTTNVSSTLVPNSFLVDNDNGYMEFTLSVTLPLSYTDANAATCAAAFGPSVSTAYAISRTNVTLNLLYSFVRPEKFPNNLLDGKYVPMPIAEKDPIHHKYGSFQTLVPFRDQATGLLGAQENTLRFDPNRDIVYYFAPGVPDDYKAFFTRAGGIVDSTNAVLQKAGATGRLKLLNYNDDTTLGDGKGPVRHVGDIRYSSIIWHSDFDNGSQLLGVAQFVPDNRTGQLLSATVNVFEGQFRDTALQRLSLFLQSTGAEFLTPAGEFDDTKYPATCTEGDTVPLVDAKIADKINSASTVYGKMQAYLQKPISTYGNLGPVNFLPTHDKDFYDAYFAVLPYQIYSDPQANPFVSPDGDVFGTAAMQNWEGLKKLVEFNKLAASIDHGDPQFDVNSPTGMNDAITFGHKLTELTDAVVDYGHIRARQPIASHADDIGLFNFYDIYKKNGRGCVGGKWETRAQYEKRLITSLNAAVALHEFGHTLGLRHNFMGSVDQRNFPTDKNGNVLMYASSIMDYNQAVVEGFYLSNASTNGGGWPPYDAGALGFIYGNNHDTAHVGPVAATGTPAGISGQVSKTAPWNDPLGFKDDGTTEIPFLYCTDEHLAYTPLCRQYDMGVTPSEIMANELQMREWNYLWTNFRLYHKYFDLSNYGQSVATAFSNQRRFLAQWSYDWSPGELTNTLRLIGIKAPTGTTAGEYFSQLTNKFNNDISIANQLAASYQRAIIDQASGERPYITVFDPFYGDTTQQGIQLDKVVAVSSFSSLWPAISYFDPSQVGGTQLSSAFGEDASYDNLAQSVLLDFLGASFATYTYAQIGPIASFAEETHSTWWPSTSPMASWIGGQVFYRERDFLDYLHSMAAKYQFPNCDENGLNCQPCTTTDSCTWDPRTIQVKTSQLSQSDRFNRFVAPDGRTYIWMYLPTRNQWVLADKDRNVALYTLMLNWSTLVVSQEDDGYDGAAYYELKVKYAIDSFKNFDNYQPNSP